MRVGSEKEIILTFPEGYEHKGINIKAPRWNLDIAFLKILNRKSALFLNVICKTVFPEPMFFISKFGFKRVGT